MSEFIFEIGCEELPAGVIEPALKATSKILEKKFAEHSIKHSEIKYFGTPRRMGFTIREMETSQPDRIEEVTGPKVDICFDKDNQPTKVALGFAKRHEVKVENLKQVEGPKGMCIQAVKKVLGKKTIDILPELLVELIDKIPFPKSMRWGSFDESFSRPIHWIVALLDKEVIPFSFAEIETGNFSYGHRFLKPESFEVTSIDGFHESLAEVYVIPDLEIRRKIVSTEADKLAKQVEGELYNVEGLVAEVANLVEYPFGLLGSFDREFMRVPKEILIASMTSHQRYFPIMDSKGELLPNFVFFANTKTEDMDVVVNGNGRVLRARLSDAMFFYDEDRKKKLFDFSKTLDKVTFQEKLGSLDEKVSRIVEHIKYLTPHINAKVLNDAVRAGELCKADLVTSVVNEFAELQGVMGKLYAESDGETPAVCDAIEQHYWPKFAGDNIPYSDVGNLVALADKMDTIVGCFGVGLIPTGTADPFALRRGALGILNILVGRGYRIHLGDWIDFAVGALRDKITGSAEETSEKVKGFIEGRYKYWRTNEYPQDVVDGVMAAQFNIIPNVEKKLEALTEFKKKEGFEALAGAFKRVMNILKENPEAVVNPDLFDSDAEHELWNVYQNVRDEVSISIKDGEYLAALDKMTQLKDPVDKFFDDVMVMVDNEFVKNNRLSLLSHLADMFTQIADFRKLTTE